MGSRSSVLLFVLAFGVLFSLIYQSFQLNYFTPHNPDTIPTEPKISQAQAIQILENEYRKQVPRFQEAYLHFFYYNYTRELAEDEEYQRYLRSIAPGWKLSQVKMQPELLSLTLVYVHANGTIYSIDPEKQKFEKICDEPSVNCPPGRKAGQAAIGRLVYEVGANVEAKNNEFEGDIHYVIDAETGKVVYHMPYPEPRPMLPQFILDNHMTIKQLEELKENTDQGLSVEIVQNASQVALNSKGDNRGYKPAFQEVFFNTTLVVWFNYDEVSHTVTSDSGYVDLLGEKFDSGVIEPGEYFEFVFIEFGDFSYHCEIHPWMKGSVSVSTPFV